MAATVLNDEINNMDLHKLDRITKEQYEFALNRIDELLPLITDETPANDRNAIELTLMSDIVESYEKKHFPIGKPSVSELRKFCPTRPTCKGKNFKILGNYHLVKN